MLYALAFVGSLCVAAFLIYVCAFGGSSAGFIGDLHHSLTSCACIKAILPRCIIDRCCGCASRLEEYCCWRPNPALQLFYLSLMGGGFALFYMHSILKLQEHCD